MRTDPSKLQPYEGGNLSSKFQHRRYDGTAKAV